MNGETITAFASAMNALGITGVSVGLACLSGFLIWRMWLDQRQARATDDAIASATDATTNALTALTEQTASNSRLIERLHDKADTAAGRSSEIGAAGT